MNRILELYGTSTRLKEKVDWFSITEQQFCPYLNRICVKSRKSSPNITIGTCSVDYSRKHKWLMICPHRLLEKDKIFFDCLHLLTLHEPGNELHAVQEVKIPGGSVDYFLVSARGAKVKDFVGIELQTIDTTGTVWPERQRFLHKHSIKVNSSDVNSNKTFGMNWKMTCKTILVQLHHKIKTFEAINKHLVLSLQDHLMDYMRGEFQLDHLENARLGDSMHLHTYHFSQTPIGEFRIDLDNRYSTNADGIATSLGLGSSSNVELQAIIELLEEKISDSTLLSIT